MLTLAYPCLPRAFCLLCVSTILTSSTGPSPEAIPNALPGVDELTQNAASLPRHPLYFTISLIPRLHVLASVRLPACSHLFHGSRSGDAAARLLASSELFLLDDGCRVSRTEPSLFSTPRHASWRCLCGPCLRSTSLRTSVATGVWVQKKMNTGVQHPKIHTDHWNVERHRALPPPSSAHLAAFEDHSQSYPAVTDSYPTSGGPYEVSPAKRVRISGVLASSAAGWATGQQHGQSHDAELGPFAETDPGAPTKSSYREKNDHDITVKKKSNATTTQGGGTSNSSNANATNNNNKSRRVRTGCLTCRGRHLKCDEAFPECNNCRKSCRECKRGLRLNFIDTRVKSPPFVPPTLEWSGMSSFRFP